MIDKNNLRSDKPARIIGYEDSADRTPIPLAGCPAAQRVYLAQPTLAICVGFPTWGCVGCSGRVTVFQWKGEYETTLEGAPLFVLTASSVSDCAICDLPFPSALEAGEYLFLIEDGGTGNGSAGVWVFGSGVTEGTLFLGGKEREGELQLLFRFVCTPRRPFGKDDGDIRIKTTEWEKQIAAKQIAHFLEDPAVFPVEITIGGEKHTGFDGSFRLLSKTEEEENGKKSTHFSFRHESGLIYILNVTHWTEYAAYEWNAEIRNDSDEPSPVISEWFSASPTFSVGNPVLRGVNGDGGFHHDPYSPYFVQLTDCDYRICSPSGRSTYQRFPYFNLTGEGGGVFFALGWPGKWEAVFSSHGSSVQIKGRQKTLSASIPPHERFISPSSLFLAYKGSDQLRAANLWRHFFMDCLMKRTGGELFAPHISGGTSWIYGEMKDATDENQVSGIRTYLEHGIPIDFWWMDAGWYYKTREESLDVWLPVGTWFVDKKRFPSGMKDISEFAHKNGVQTLLWFEPEVCRLPVEQFGPTTVKKEWLIPGSGTKLVDIGNPDFRNFMLERVFSIMDEGEIDLYRQDYGVGGPTDEMHAADPEGESGYIENRYFIGYYDYLDRIAARYPDKMLDSCAAGGGRNDLTTMRRAVPLHKTDADYSNYTMKTAMHQGLFAWLPYFGTPLSGPGPLMNHPDKFTLRCSYCPWLALGADVAHPENVDWDQLRSACREWEKIKDYYYADYYPLLPWNNERSGWRGWEFFDPEKEEGFIEVIRDAESRESARHIVLHGLRPDSDYKLINLDGGSMTVSGRSLLEEGLLIRQSPRHVRIYLIKKA